MLTIRRTAIVALLALMAATNAVAQGSGATISGRVTTDAGAPLRYAVVRITELGIGTQTSETGSYALTVLPAQVRGQQVTLAVRSIGYRSMTSTVTLNPGAITRDFSLPVNPMRLGEVVVTGAGTQSSTERLGATISSVEAKTIEKSNETNVVSALAAKAPNVLVTSSSGEPGAATFIQIRGAKSIEGTSQPLFVVDGVPIDNSTNTFDPVDGSTAGTAAVNRAADLNPADIESVEILKGSAAAAIYGARAGSGVVLITTKRGRSGPTRYTMRSSISVDDVNRSVPLQRLYGHGTRGNSPTCGGPNCGLTGSSFGPRLAASTRTYDHFGEMFRTGNTWDNTLSVSGGSDRTTFYLSAGRMDQKGIIIGPNNWYDRTTALLKGTHQLNERLQIGANIQYTDARGSFVQKGSNLSGLLLGALRTPPEFNNSVYRDTVNGLHRSYRFPRPTRLSLSRRYDNPFFVVNEQTNNSNVGRSLGNINASYAPFRWLDVKLTLGGDYSSDDRIQVAPPSSSNEPTGLIDRGNYTTYQIDQNLIATAQHALTNRISGSLTLGQNLNSRRFTQLQARGRGYIAPNVNSLNNTVSANLLSFEYRSLIRLQSYFGEAKTDLYDQVFFTLGVRNDASSTFGESVRRNWFPKASAAWTVSRTLGMDEGKGMLSYAKLRAAYGEVGREPFPYQILTGYESGTVGDGWGPFLNPSQGGNGGLYASINRGQDKLKPERTRESELGADLGFLDQKADLALTYYNGKSSDVILSVPLPRSTGFGSQVQNAATMTNKGWEVALNARPYTSRNLALTTGVQWARNRNLVKQLAGADFIGLAGGFLGAVKEGYAHGVFYDYDFARCRLGGPDADNVIDGVDVNAACRSASAPDGALYIDASGFPVLDPALRVVGDPNPDWTGNVSAGLTLFHKLNFSALLDMRRGGDVWNGTKGALYNFGAHKDTEIRGESRTFGVDYFAGTPTIGPGKGRAVVIDQSWYTNLGSGFNGPASQFIEDGSFTKLREVSMSYTFDQPFVRQYTGMSTLDVRVAGRNLALWTDYTGIDPESNLGGAVAARGNDYFNNPQTRSFVFTFSFNR